MRRPRILHLEDDEELSALLAITLDRAGLDVEIVTVDRRDTFEAALEGGGVDLVLSDCAVPQYSGLEALHGLRRRNFDIPFVVLSGSAASEGNEPYLAAGAAECLLKDDLPRVAETLRRLLARAGAPPRAQHARPPEGAAAALAWAVTRLTRSVSVAEVVSIVPQAARLMCGADVATIAFRDGDLCRQMAQDGDAPRSPGLDLALDHSVCGRAMREGQPVVIEDVTAESAGLGILVGQSETRGAIAVPVGRGFPVAAVAVYRKQPHRPVGHELELLTALADVTALMLERTGVAGGNLNLETGATERHEVSAEPEAVARLLAHDLRNPLWQIRGFAEHLQDDHAPALGETGRSTLEHLLRASDELGHVIEGLIELAEISSAPLSPRLLDLGAAARDVAATLSIASGRAVEWRIDDGPLAHADPELLRILLEKLLSNALRNTRSRDIALVEVGAIASAGAFTTFFVRDNGVGFGPADRSRLFAPFQRHHSREEAPPGAGTGLAIVRRIVGRHGGEVWAEGAPDAGAAFYFTLPAPR